MADKRISQLVDRGTVANNDVVPIVVSGATTTNKATISSIQTYMQGNLDLGVTSVGITLGSSGTDVSVSGSPITSSGNITINLPTASATNRGLLSAADWVTFNSKQDAGSFVTLDTTQTITAQKTFTTSGSSDTMIISHGSGSGIALDVIKAGNSEAIRVQKTSGSGNAMTISGGNFEAGTIVKTGGTSVQYLMADGSVSTLTNPVTGTGAAGQVAYWNGTNSQTGSNNLFWDNANVKLGIGISTPESTGLTIAGGGIIVSLDSGAARKVLELYATSTGAKVSSTYVGASSYGSLELLTSNVPRLTITAAGDSTFSGALNGTSASFTGAANFATSTGNVGIGTSTPDIIGYGTKTLGILGSASDFPNMQIGIPGTSGSTTDVMGDINFFSRNGTGAVVSRSLIRSGLDGATNSNSLSFFTMNAGTLATRLTIASTGAATFNSEGLTINRNSGNPYVIFQTNGSDLGSIYGNTGGGIRLRNASSDVLTIASTGAATFSNFVIALLFSGENSTSGSPNFQSWNKATSGDNKFVEFYTEGGGGTLRGSIDFNRGAGLTRYNTTSDANLKNIIGDSDKQKSVNLLNSTRIREYSWKNDKLNKTQIGVIAQELYNTYKGAVSEGSNEELINTENYKPWAVDKTAFTFHLIAGWQEHERIIKELKAEIDTLKNQIK